MKNKGIVYLLIGVIVLLAIGLRFYQLGQVPVSLYWDEAAMLVDAKTIAATGRDMHNTSWLTTMFPSYGDYKLPVYIWFASVSVKLFGVSEWALRLPSAFAGVGTVVVAGLLGFELHQKLQPPIKKSDKKMTNTYAPLSTGLATAGVMAITPWSILFSRTGFEGHLGQFWVALSIYLTLKAATNKWLLPISILLGGLATYTYFSVRFVWPVVFSLFWIIAHQTALTSIVSPGKWFATNKLTLLLLVGGLIGYLGLLQPMVRSPLYQASNQFRLSTTSILNAHDYALESNILREQAGNSLIDRIVFHRHWLMIRELMKNYADNLDLSFMFLTGDPNLRHGTGSHGVLLLPTLPLLLLGFYSLAHKNKLLLASLACWWVVALLPASIPETTPHALRSLNALVPVVLIIGFGASFVGEWVVVQLGNKEPAARLLGLVVASGTVGALLLASLSFTYHYFTLYPKQSAYDWQDGYRQLVTTIQSNQSQVRTVWVNPAEDRFYLWLLAYGPYTAEQIQALPKEGYKVTQIDNIVFKGFEWEKLNSLDHKAMVVAQPHDMKERVAAYGATATPSAVLPVTGNDGATERFTAVIFEPNL